MAWTRQAGSSANDEVAGGDAEGISPLLFGSAQGAVNGESSLGGQDAYFYATASGDGSLTVNQRGTGADEHVTSGVVEGSTLWLLGNGSNKYTVTQVEEENEEEEGSLSLTSTPISSESGFVLGYTIGGDVVRAFNLNDEGDASTEQFAALTGFSGDLVAAGLTDGDFTGSASTSGSSSAIIARMSLVPEAEPDEESDVFRNRWRYQLNAGDSEITRLANYRDDEIVALTRQGSKWVILLFSPEGVLLTP